MINTGGRAITAAIALAWLAPGFAGPALSDDRDPPERVAVVEVVEGVAAAQPAGVGEWTGDLVNRPLTTGDKLWVDADSRAELHLGSAAIRVGANTGMQFLDVGDRVAQLRLTAGSMNVRLRYLSPDETFEVDTPNTAVTLSQAGEYRIDVSDSGDVVAVAVWRGEAEVAGETQSFTLEPQQQGEFRGSGTLGVEFRDLPPADGLDQWAQYRDQREDSLLTADFLSRDVTGYADLEGYGNWQTDPEVGAVWQPQVPVGWAPYSQGYWVWIAPWGWTWIDSAPWGFAPFHYGRWVHIRSGWAWCPGQLSVRPVYAPALVIWASGAGGQVVWFPLGYNEIYRPSRHVSDQYLRRVNVTNTYINNTVTIDSRTTGAPAHYANQGIPGALTAVDRDTFTAARPVGRAAKPIDASLAVLTAANHIAPGARSLVPAVAPGVPRGVGVPPRAVFSRPVTVRMAPPPSASATAEARHVIVTTVLRPETSQRPPATSAPSALPVQPSQAPRSLPRPLPDAAPARERVPAPQFALPPPRPAPPAALPAAPQPAPQPVPRVDRPAVLPRQQQPARMDQPRSEPLRTEPPRIEQPRVEQPRVERPQPEPHRESAPVEPARKAPDRTPAKIEH